MNILIIGGTKFLGRALVETALAQGHGVTLFNRGQSDAGAFPNVEEIHGDRHADLHLLDSQNGGRTWDAAIDTCGYTSAAVRASAQALADKVEHYTFISSMSVYADQSTPDANETAAVAKLDEGQPEGEGYETYGPSKALAEQAAEAAMPGRVLNVRAGLLVGPYDYVERFPYWVRRIGEGRTLPFEQAASHVLVPDVRGQSVQVVDVRDVSAWILQMAESHSAGTFNVTGPERPMTFEEMVQSIRAATGSDANFVWADEAWLIEQEIKPFQDLPIWLPSGGTHDGFLARNIDRALAAGLTFRPLADTVRDVLAWDRARRKRGEATSFPLEVMGAPLGLSPEREAALIAAWRAQSGAST